MCFRITPISHPWPSGRAADLRDSTRCCKGRQHTTAFDTLKAAAARSDRWWVRDVSKIYPFSCEKSVSILSISLEAGPRRACPPARRPIVGPQARRRWFHHAARGSHSSLLRRLRHSEPRPQPSAPGAAPGPQARRRPDHACGHLGRRLRHSTYPTTRTRRALQLQDSPMPTRSAVPRSWRSPRRVCAPSPPASRSAPAAPRAAA